MGRPVQLGNKPVGLPVVGIPDETVDWLEPEE